MITQSELKSEVSYDLITGIFTNSKIRGKLKPGDVCGNSDCGYIKMTVAGRKYRAHRLAFLYVLGSMPPDAVDHISGDGLDNRWINLRHADSSSNMKNLKRFKSNTSGLMGVHWNIRAGKWRVRANNHGVRFSLGYYDNIFDAACVRKSHEKKFGYHENHNRKSNKS